jgi:hypothetical protein
MEVKDGTSCKFLDCEETARVRVVILYVYPHDRRENRKQQLRLCAVHAELLQRIVQMQIMGTGIDDTGSNDRS